MTKAVVRLDRDDPLAVLTVDSPPLNLWTAQLECELRVAVDELVLAPPRGLLIRAEGRVFTAGIDVHEFDGLTAETGGALWRRALAIIRDLEELPCPTVCASHGLCLTWGLELALACDVVLASDVAQFGLVERVVGIVPSMGGVQRMARRAGPARTADFVMTGEPVSAQLLHAWGVVSRILAAEGFDDEARVIAQGLAEGPTRAHAVTKLLIRSALEAGAPAADALVPRWAGALFETDDARGAIASFLAHGPGHATFDGR